MSATLIAKPVGAAMIVLPALIALGVVLASIELSMVKQPRSKPILDTLTTKV